MKKCPFCAEEIQDDAIKCKHCGEWLFQKNQKILSVIPASQEDKQNTERILLKQKRNVEIGIFLEYLALIMSHFINTKVLPTDPFKIVMGGMFWIAIFLIAIYTNKLTESLGWTISKRSRYCVLNILPLINAFVVVNLAGKTKKKIEEMKKRAPFSESSESHRAKESSRS